MINKERTKSSKTSGSSSGAKAQQHHRYPTPLQSPSTGKSPFPLQLLWLAKCSEVGFDDLRGLSQAQWFCDSPFPPPYHRGHPRAGAGDRTGRLSWFVSIPVTHSLQRNPRLQNDRNACPTPSQPCLGRQRAALRRKQSYCSFQRQPSSPQTSGSSQGNG